MASLAQKAVLSRSSGRLLAATTVPAQSGAWQDVARSLFEERTPGQFPVTWTLVGVGTAATTTGTTVTPSLPAGTQTGDLLVAFVATRNSPTFTAPSGWSIPSGGSQSSGNTSTSSPRISSGAVAWIVRGGSAPATDWGLSVSCRPIAQIFAYRPSAGVLGVIAASSVTAASDSTTTTTSSLTTDDEDCLVIAGLCAADLDEIVSIDAATDPATETDSSITLTAPRRGVWKYRSGTLAHSSGNAVALHVGDALRETAGATGSISTVSQASNRHVLIAVAFRSSVSTPGNAPGASAAGVGGIAEGAASGQAIAPGGSASGAADVGALSASGQALSPDASASGVGASSAPSASGKHTTPFAQIAGTGVTTAGGAQGRALATGSSVAGSGSVTAPSAEGGFGLSADTAGVGGVSASAATGRGLAPEATAAGAASIVADPAIASENNKAPGVGGVMASPATGQASATGRVVRGLGRVGFGQPFDDPSGTYFEAPETGLIRRFLFRHGRGHAFMRERGRLEETYVSLLGLRRVDPWSGSPSGPVIADVDLDDVNAGEEV